jgi:regulator of sirC expression with transglutaminase-like and TPR domain
MAVVKYLREVLSGTTSNPRLDRAALDVASIQYPGLEPEPFLDQLNSLASQLGDRLRNFNDGRDFVEKAQSFLFGELGFRGEDADYSDPRNSCLNQVIERRTGIPVALSVFYMEVARRLQMPVFGIGLPRHFVIQFDDGNYSTFIDPFHGGRLITAQDCFRLAGASVADPSLLQRVSKKYIAMRMLRNLSEVYLRAEDFERAALTLDLLIEGAPAGALFYRQRGVAALRLKRYRAARADFETYLKLEPSASDREDVLLQIQVIHQWLAQVN